MSVLRFIAFLIFMLVCLVGLFFFGPSLTQYSRFRHKSDNYYAELARACDAVIAQRLAGTNQLAELSVRDPTLPNVIRDLRPLKINVEPKRIWILHGGSIEFGVI